MAPGTAGDRYDEAYYRDEYGGGTYGRNPGWLAAFRTIADELVARFAPGRSFDAGCAHGMLVEALRDRGVDAYGCDISAFALANARADVRPYLRQAAVDEPLGGWYDLVTCIEVLEHVPMAEAEQAIGHFAASTDTVVFSSTPTGLEDPTHMNVQHPAVWLDAFARHGFELDLTIDATFIAPHAMVLRRGGPHLTPPVRAVSAERFRLAAQLADETAALRDVRRRTTELDGELAELRRHYAWAVADRESARAEAAALRARLIRLAVDERDRLRRIADELESFCAGIERSRFQRIGNRLRAAIRRAR